MARHASRGKGKGKGKGTSKGKGKSLSHPSRGPKPQPLFRAARVLGTTKGSSAERVSLGSRARPANYFSALAEPEPFAFAPSILAGGVSPPLHAATTAPASSSSLTVGANALDFSALARELSASKDTTPAPPTIAWDFSAFTGAGSAGAGATTAAGAGAGSGATATAPSADELGARHDHHAAERDELLERLADRTGVSHKKRVRLIKGARAGSDYSERSAARLDKKDAARRRLKQAKGAW